MGDHTYKQFDTELETVRAHILEMGGLVEEQVNRAIEALVTGNNEMAQEVIACDSRVNDLEVLSDLTCTNIIARRQPAAGDLRMIITIIKILTDLERIGDEAVKIARFSQKMQQSERIVMPRYSEIRFMAELTMKMLRAALDSFARVDVTGAVEIARQDMEVDEEFQLIARHLITYMMEDPRNISMFIDLMFVSKSIERIGDHAKNISKYVVYMVKGTDVRHATVEELERHLA